MSTYKYTSGDVEFSNIKDVVITSGQKISSSKYNIDEEGNIISPNKIINAIDIDWNNAKIRGVDNTISTSADLLQVISNSIRHNNGGGDGNSLPIYDAETIERLRDENNLPNKYISLGDDYNLPNSTSLISNLLSVIANLQAEVTKLKNTFTRGIYSYNNEATFMSTTLNNYGDTDVEEPLWAIDERDLDEVELGFNIETSKVFTDGNQLLYDNEDERMFAYITAESSNIEVTLCDTDNINNLYKFNLNDYLTCGKCTIMLIISRTNLTIAMPLSIALVNTLVIVGS